LLDFVGDKDLQINGNTGSAKLSDDQIKLLNDCAKKPFTAIAKDGRILLSWFT
jgi:hypothetical protein